MADESVSAAGAGAGSGAASGGSGAAVSSTSTSSAVSTTSTGSGAQPSGAAPATVTTSTDTSKSGEMPTRNAGETDSAYINRFMSWKDGQKKGDPAVASGDKTPEQIAAEKKVADEKAVAGAGAKTAEEKAAADKAAADAKAKEEAEKAAAAAAQKNPLDDVGPLPASKFAEALEKNPTLAAELEKAGIGKDELFAGLRESAVATQYREIFPDVETAKFAHTAASQFAAMDEAASNLKSGDMQSTADFIGNVLMPMSYKLDENGQPIIKEIKQKDGSILRVPETDGTVQVFLDNVRDVALQQIISDAEFLATQKNDQAVALSERLLGAVHELQGFIKGVNLDDGEVSEAVKAERAKLDADRAAFNKTRQDEASAKFETFRGEVTETTNSELDKVVDGLLAKSSLAPDPNDTPEQKQSKDILRSSIRKEIRDGLFTKFNADKLFLAEQDQIGRRGQSPSTKAALVKHYVRSANAAIEKVAAPILKAHGAERVRASQAQAAKIAAQVKASQSEPKGSTGISVPATPKVDQAAAIRQAYQELTGELRRMPTTEQAMARARQIIAKAGQAAATV